MPSEDGFLVGDYAARYARAMQEGEDPRYLKSVSTAKCYSVYDIENSDGTDRFRFNATVSDHDWVSALPLTRPHARADHNRKNCATFFTEPNRSSTTRCPTGSPCSTATLAP